MRGLNERFSLRKKELRRLMHERLSCLSDEECGEKSRRLCSRILSSPIWKRAEIVLAFLPLAREPDLRSLLAQAGDEGRIVGLPRMAGRSLVFHRVEWPNENLIRHPYGVLEPDPALPVIEKEDLRHKTCLVLCPGLAFDRSGGRLGRGKGFYDDFLSSLWRGEEEEGPGTGLKVFPAGVCFGLQIVGSVPLEAEDVSVAGIFTDEETILM